jgi:hypothetical protein
MKPKELKEIDAEEMDQEPSLDKLISLNDPKVLSGLKKMGERALRREAAANQTAPALNKKPSSD